MTNATDINFDTPHQRLELDHGEVAYYCFGSGPDLVFVHGWPLHGATWRRILPAFAEHYRCHVFDLPGTGRTRWDDDAPFGLWEHARTLHAAMQQVGIGEYGLVAHDSGGTIARLLATLTPGRVTAIILGNTEIPGHALEMLRWAKLGTQLPGVVSFMKLITRPRKVQEEMFRGCFADLSQIDTDFGTHFIEPMTRDSDYVRGQLRLIKHLDWSIVTDELAGIHQQIDAPVLLVWGDRDPWFPWRDAVAMLDSFAGTCEAHVIEGGKLFVHEEFSDEFASASLEFLARPLTT